MEKTKLMLEFFEETRCNFNPDIERGMVTESYIAWLEAKANISDEAIEAFQEIIRNQCDEISALKAQLRWRPVSEKPEKEGWYLASVANYRAFVMLYEKGKWFEYREDYGSYMPTIPPTHWLPIPPAPERRVEHGKE